MEATKDELYYEITQIPLVEAIEKQNHELMEKCLGKTERLLKIINERNILQNHKRGLEINIRLLKANLNNDMQLQMF